LMLRLNYHVTVCLRSPFARPSVRRGAASQTELVRATSVGKIARLAAAVGAWALVLAANEAVARTGGGAVGGGRGGVAIARPMVRPMTPHAFRHHRGFFPGAGGFYYAPDGTPITDVTPPPSSTSQDIH